MQPSAANHFDENTSSDPRHRMVKPSSQSGSAPRYDRVAVALHWLIGTALLAQIAFGFLLDDIAPRSTPGRADVINLHKSIGMLLGFCVLLRLGWRLAHPAPPLPNAMAAWQRSTAVWNHRLLYVCMVVQPLSGYIGSNFSKYGVKFFGIPLAPWAPQSAAAYAFFNTLHVYSAWLFALLIAGHIAVGIKHALIDRDGVFARIVWARDGR